MSDLVARLNQALTEAGHILAGGKMQLLPDKGLAHDHIRLVGSGWLARIPKQSQMGLSAEPHLAYQRACFERAAIGGHAPQLHGVLPPSAYLPRGALLVEEIVGRAAQLPGDLPSIAHALAALHALPLPPAQERNPLQNEPDPLTALWVEIAAQAVHLGSAGVVGEVVQTIQTEMARLKRLVEAAPRPPRHLIAFDGHPGNFIVKAGGSAVLVDLEKCRYSYPSLDLAHATLYTSTTWDLESHAVLELGEVVGAYQAWADAMVTHTNGSAEGAAAWHVPLRRAMWLWSVTWCAKWRVLSAEQARGAPDGEDWSTQQSDQALVEHVRERVDHYLSAPIVGRVVQEWVNLERELRA